MQQGRRSWRSRPWMGAAHSSWALLLPSLSIQAHQLLLHASTHQFCHVPVIPWYCVRATGGGHGCPLLAGCRVCPSLTAACHSACMQRGVLQHRLHSSAGLQCGRPAVHTSEVPGARRHHGWRHTTQPPRQGKRRAGWHSKEPSAAGCTLEPIERNPVSWNVDTSLYCW